MDQKERLQPLRPWRRDPITGVDESIRRIEIEVRRKPGYSHKRKGWVKAEGETCTVSFDKMSTASTESAFRPGDATYWVLHSASGLGLSFVNVHGRQSSFQKVFLAHRRFFH